MKSRRNLGIYVNFLLEPLAKLYPVLENPLLSLAKRKSDYGK
jgi:hypothetical protein